MAPRGRRPKARLMRIDAALDAMRPLGFPAPVVRKSVKKLLEVYGGNEAWCVFEEDAYKLLIDTILEDLEEEEKLIGHDHHINEDQHDEEQDPQENHKVVEKRQLEDFPADNSLSLKEAISTEVSTECNFTTTCVLPPLPNFLPTSQKRKPTYGWISDDDEEDDFVVLTPAKRSSMC